MNPTVRAATRPSVLHVSSAEGGGVDRYIRELAGGAHRRHFLWHAGSGINVIEDMAAQQFLPLSKAVEDPAAATALAEWLRSNSTPPSARVS